jgi:hypothetical protein
MNFHTPIIIDHATEIYRAITLECERRRQQLGRSMWKVDDAAGLQDGFYSKLLHADRPSGRQVRWETLQLVITALYPAGFDVEIKHKSCDPLTAEKHRLKVMFAAADNNRLTRRALMRELGKRGAAARQKKLGSRERTKIAKRASRVAAIKRSKRAAAKPIVKSVSGTRTAVTGYGNKG